MLMSRKAYRIWFGVFTLVQFLWVGFGFHYNLIELLIGLVLGAILMSGIFGLAVLLWGIYEEVVQWWLYAFDNDKWLELYDYGVGIEGFSYESIVIKTVLALVFLLCIAVHLWLSARRCKDIGVSKWRCLIPLYNPIVLLYKARKDV